jgi:hypothetical protein
VGWGVFPAFAASHVGRYTNNEVILSFVVFLPTSASLCRFPGHIVHVLNSLIFLCYRIYFFLFLYSWTTKCRCPVYMPPDLQLDHLLWHYPRICLEGLAKSTENFCSGYPFIGSRFKSKTFEFTKRNCCLTPHRSVCSTAYSLN